MAISLKKAQRQKPWHQSASCDINFGRAYFGSFAVFGGIAQELEVMALHLPVKGMVI